MYNEYLDHPEACCAYVLLDQFRHTWEEVNDFHDVPVMRALDGFSDELIRDLKRCADLVDADERVAWTPDLREFANAVGTEHWLRFGEELADG